MAKSAGHITQIPVPRAPAVQQGAAIDAPICPWLYMWKLHSGIRQLAISPMMLSIHVTEKPRSA